MERNAMDSTQRELAPMNLLEMKSTTTETTQAQKTPPASLSLVKIVATCLTAFWRFVVRRVGSQHKILSVRDTAALGDRRFVSTIQFERRRYLIGSSPA